MKNKIINKSFFVIITNKETYSYVVLSLFNIIQYFYWLLFKLSNLNNSDTSSTPHIPKIEKENLKNFLSQNFCFASVSEVSVTLHHVDSSHSVPRNVHRTYCIITATACCCRQYLFSLTFTVHARTLLEIMKIEIHLNKIHKMAANGA
jgi:hypothetical protein